MLFFSLNSFMNKSHAKMLQIYIHKERERVTLILISFIAILEFSRNNLTKKKELHKNLNRKVFLTTLKKQGTVWMKFHVL